MAIGKTRSSKRWSQFYCSYVESGLCEPDRRKTMKAMQRFSDKIPPTSVDRIPLFTAVFAPSATTLGLASSWFHPAGPERTGFMIYLSPRLEGMSQSRVDSVVAHEFAHAILRHESDSLPPGKAPRHSEDLPSEKAADELVTQWGFRPALSFNRRSSTE